ncbi:4-oxalocrotonate tautomerase [Massilia sp. CCM 8695]|uniref:4-oxalocrotonate tautomerase n=1 Tax=Massilia frigida TaxID=2609281 RepID=A0ABX0NHG2_9BURK|nr:4-oxalocrotonate tautomerase family protein [Massilia frigida]NHZ82731.1 4-oxalocrotonate tautomerase [Massilia frigida]
MPILNVKVSAVKTPELIRQIADLLLDKTTRILRKKRELTSIAIDFVDPDSWIVAGLSLREQRKHSVYVDIKVTDETNTKDEKALYIAQVFAGFAALLGPLHDESYIYVDDVRATAYGYGGKTQECRYQHPDA